MKVVLATDMEGISCVDDWRQLMTNDPVHFLDARRHLMEDTNAAIRGLRAAGATEVLVIDGHSHGDPPNLMDDQIVGGTVVPRSPRMYSVIDKSCSAVAMVGYHSMAGTVDGYLSHTVSGIISWRVNGRWLGETAMSAGRASELGIPTVMVSGDAALAREVHDQLPGTETAVVKTATSRSEVTCLPRVQATRLIESAAERGLRNRDRCALMRFTTPLTVDVRLADEQLAASAAILPRSARLDARTLRYTAENFGEAVQFFLSVLYLAQRVGTQETIATYEQLPAVEALKWQRMEAYRKSFASKPSPFSPLD